MFMDMKNSTGIAEKLGHLQYSHFLQDVFKLSTDIVIDKKGEIYQFVGDEMVVTWPSNLGYQNNNTLQFFYKFQAILEKNEASFMKTYGEIPLFKAGIHIGVVSVAEVGEINTQIAYHGDVVNTTSRIQELCNQFHTNLLVSDSFMKGMEAPLLNFQENAAVINLRGRQQPITIYALDVSMPD
jgi:adenylate cyclase